MPTLNGRLTTATPAAAATRAVPSVEPSLTTTISSSGSAAWISASTAPSEPSSLKAGTIAIERSFRGACGDRAAGAVACSTIPADYPARYPCLPPDRGGRALDMTILPRRVGAPLERARGLVLRPFQGRLEAGIVWAFHRLY